MNRPVGKAEISRAPPGWTLDAEIGKMFPSSPPFMTGFIGYVAMNIVSP